MKKAMKIMKNAIIIRRILTSLIATIMYLGFFSK